jgi:hypothetical protein
MSPLQPNFQVQRQMLGLKSLLSSAAKGMFIRELDDMAVDLD